MWDSITIAPQQKDRPRDDPAHAKPAAPAGHHAVLMKPIATALALCVAGSAHAQSLPIPSNAERVTSLVQAASETPLATGPWADGVLPQRALPGRARTEVWRVTAPDISTEQLLAPLRTALDEAGFNTIFECGTNACGGFDFRFAVPAVPPPLMQVNLADFRYLSAIAPNGSDAVAVLASSTPTAGYIQILQIGAAAEADGPATRDAAPALSGGTSSVPVPASDALADRLDAQGHAILGGLVFPSGADRLGDSDEADLAALAAYLAGRPGLRVALVGHTDAVGALESNIALSRRRAEAVRDALVDRHGVVRQQVDAQGMGYLAPVASNLSPEGRAANRRVEVIVLSDDG